MLSIDLRMLLRRDAAGDDRAGGADDGDVVTDIPTTFNSVEHYKLSFYPFLVQEMRAQIVGASVRNHKQL